MTSIVLSRLRCLGRGIAVALGTAGWTVWVTGRSSRDRGRASQLPGTVEETAQAVTAAGGRGIAAVCDHRDDEQTRAVLGPAAGIVGRDVRRRGPCSLRDHRAVRAAAASHARQPGRDGVDGGRLAAPGTARGRLQRREGSHDRLALALSVALAPDGVASVALYPGLVRTEGVLRFAEHLDLAADAAVMSLTGRVLTVTDLARRYAADPAT